VANSLWVLIAAARDPGHLARTLQSLAAAHKPASYGGCLVVENGPRSGIEQAIRSFASHHRFHHHYVPIANKSHALNCGLALVEDALVFMTDDDVRLDPQVLVAYDEAAKHIAAGRFYGGSVQIEAPHGLPPAWMRKFYPLTIAEPWSLPYSQPTVIQQQTFMGTNWAAFASDLRKIRGFDTRLGPGGTSGATGQETEAQRRLLAAGVEPVYVPSATTWHCLHREFLEPEWVLRRAYRHALEWGIRRTRDNQPLLPALARAALGRLNARLKGTLLRFLGNEQRRFEAAFHEAKWRGRWHGLWLGRRWDDLPQHQPPGPLQHARAA
jgi:glycosyltransferase involved in cell wall biosynthesis